jgi:hypothetical protein
MMPSPRASARKHLLLRGRQVALPALGLSAITNLGWIH